MSLHVIELVIDDTKIACDQMGEVFNDMPDNSREARVEPSFINGQSFFWRQRGAVERQLLRFSADIIADQTRNAAQIQPILNHCHSTDSPRCGSGYHCMKNRWNLCATVADYFQADQDALSKFVKEVSNPACSKREGAIDFGDRIYNALLPDIVKHYIEFLTDGAAQVYDKSLTFCLIDRSEIGLSRKIPWEMLCVKRRSEGKGGEVGKRVFLGERFPLSLYWGTMEQYIEQVKKFKLQHPAGHQRSVLFLSDGSNSARREGTVIEKALARSGCKVVTESDLDLPAQGRISLDKLLFAIAKQKANIIHIAAHSGASPQEDSFWQSVHSGAVGVELLVKGKKVKFALDQLAGFPFGSLPHLVLNVCHGANPLVGALAKGLFLDAPAYAITSRSPMLKTGVLSCVANRWLVSVPDALMFTDTFYRTLRGSAGSVAQAVNTARRALAAKKTTAGVGYTVYGFGNTGWDGQPLGMDSSPPGFPR